MDRSFDEVPGARLSSLIVARGSVSRWHGDSQTHIQAAAALFRGGFPLLLLDDEFNCPGGVRQLRDPAIYREGRQAYIVYAIAGESGLAIAKLVE